MPGPVSDTYPGPPEDERCPACGGPFLACECCTTAPETTEGTDAVDEDIPVTDHPGGTDK